jgi:outer membrane protein assembly factor BamB
MVYGTAEKDSVKAFHFYPQGRNGVYVDFFRESDVIAPDGMPGGAISLSANGERNGIIWGSFPIKDNTFFVQRARLVAFDAETLQVIWSDDRSKAYFTKFCPPTIADGKVFRAVFSPPRPLGHLPIIPAGSDKGKLLVYGLCTRQHPCIRQ